MTLLHGISLLTSEDAELVAPMPRNECVKRLREKLDSSVIILGERAVIGRVSEFSLTARKRIRYRNSFQTLLFVRLLEDSGRTRMLCRFHIRSLVRVFSLAWIAVTGVLGGAMMLMSSIILIVNPQNAPKGTWAGALLPPIIVVFFLAMVRFGRYLARGERDFLIGFLRRTVGAQDV